MKGYTLDELNSLPDAQTQNSNNSGYSLDEINSMPDVQGPPVNNGTRNSTIAKVLSPSQNGFPLVNSRESDGVVTTAVKAGVNFVPSVLSNVMGIAGAVAHPIETAKNIKSVVAGASGQAAKYVVDNTSLGQDLLNKANEFRKSRGLPELERDEKGNFIAPNTEDMNVAGNVGQYFKGRYGGVNEIKKSIAEDPAGVLLDASTILTGGETIAPKLAKIAEVSGAAKTANTINKVGEFSGAAAKMTSKASGVPFVLDKVTSKIGSISSGAKDVATKPAIEIQKDALVKGLEGTGDRLKTVQRNIDNNTFSIPGEDGKSVSISPVDTFREYNYRPDISIKGDISTEKIRTDIAKQRSGIEDMIDYQLKTNTSPVSLDSFKSEIEKQIRSSNDIKAKGLVTETLNKLESYISDLKQSYGDNLTLEDINRIRRVQNKDFNPDRLDFSRAVGNAGREFVYNSTPDKMVKKLLLEERKLGRADDFAEKLNGHKVEGGRLGNMFNTMLGATLGSAVDFKPLGIPVGPIIGGGVLRGAQAIKQQATFRSIPGEIKGTLEKVLPQKKSPKINETNTKASNISIPNIVSETKDKIKKGVDNIKEMSKKSPRGMIDFNAEVFPKKKLELPKIDKYTRDTVGKFSKNDGGLSYIPSSQKITKVDMTFKDEVNKILNSDKPETTKAILLEEYMPFFNKLGIKMKRMGPQYLKDIADLMDETEVKFGDQEMKKPGVKMLQNRFK